MNHLLKATRLAKRKPSSKLLNIVKELRSQHPVALSPTTVAEPLGNHRQKIMIAMKKSYLRVIILREGQLVTSLSLMIHTNKSNKMQLGRAFHRIYQITKLKLMPSRRILVLKC